MDAGADVLETNTFQSTRLRLEEWGLAEQTHALNVPPRDWRARSPTATQARDGRPRFVAGSIGPTGKLPSSDDPALSDVTFDQLSDTFREQAAALIEGGADVLLIETSVDILEVKAALDGIRRAKRGARPTGCRRPGAGLPRPVRRDAARHRDPGRDRHARGDAGRRDRA